MTAARKRLQLGVAATVATVATIATVAAAIAAVTSHAVAQTQTDAKTHSAPSLLAGAYNEEQALRGRDLYYSLCSACHGEEMAGRDQASPLVGPQFVSTWTGEPLNALAARIRTMPPDRPNSLSLAQAVDLMAYVLWFNGFPIGTTPLAANASELGAIKFATPPPAQ